MWWLKPARAAGSGNSLGDPNRLPRAGQARRAPAAPSCDGQARRAAVPVLPMPPGRTVREWAPEGRSGDD